MASYTPPSPSSRHQVQGYEQKVLILPAFAGVGSCLQLSSLVSSSVQLALPQTPPLALAAHKSFFSSLSFIMSPDDEVRA